MADVTGLVVAATAVAVACAGGLVWRARNGRITTEKPPTGTGDVHAAPATTAVLRDLGVVAGAPVTLAQFSSAVCAPCRATRVLCEDIAAQTPGVTHLEISAEEHLDAVRALDIWRTPTVLIVDAHGVIRHRVSGLPARADLLAAIAGVTGTAPARSGG